MTTEEKQIVRRALKDIMGNDFARGVDVLCHLIGRCYLVAHLRKSSADIGRRLLAGRPRCKRKKMPR